MPGDIEPSKADESVTKENEKTCTCVEKDQNPDQQPVAKEEEEFIQELSYSALMKFIESNHPVHPITKKSFNFGDRIEVKEFYIKLFDPCNMNKFIKKCFKNCKKYKKFALKGGFSGSSKDDAKIKPAPDESN